MKVAIWGSYAYGNFGDELMAVQFATFLRSLGTDVVVYALDPVVADAHAIGTSNDIEEVIRGSAFCVFGGGSLLSGNKPTTGAYAEAKKREYEEFLMAIERHQCPLYFISIGGDGEFGEGSQIAAYREALLNSELCQMATVRQRVDTAILKSKFQIPAHFFPDVLLSIGEMWRLNDATLGHDEVHIGLNLPKSFGWTIRILKLLQQLPGNVVLHWLGTVRSGSTAKLSQLEFLPGKESKRIRRHAYQQPLELLRTLQGLDLMITTKLHIGLTSLSFGVPYVCVGRSLKCKAFLDSISANHAYWGEISDQAKCYSIIRAATSKRVRTELTMGFDKTILDEQKRESRGHLELIQRIVESNA